MVKFEHRPKKIYSLFSLCRDFKHLREDHYRLSNRAVFLGIIQYFHEFTELSFQVNVDCFLYNNDAVEDLISHGKMSRSVTFFFFLSK